MRVLTVNIYEYMSVGESEKPLDRIVTDGGFSAIFRTIACIGDSLSSGEFESVNPDVTKGYDDIFDHTWINPDGTKGYHDSFDYSWGQFIARDTGAKVYNFSRGGMTAKEYVEDFADKMGFWDKDKLAQAYIIALGVNDVMHWGFEVGTANDVCLDDPSKNATTFAGYYARIIQKIKELQPRAKFFLVTMPRHGNEGDEKRGAVRDLLDDFTRLFGNTYLIDLYTYAPVNDAEFEKKFRLGHMTPTGYVLTAKMIESYIDYIIRKNPDDFSQVGFIGTDLYYKPEN